jgi:hypothetical protein
LRSERWPLLRLVAIGVGLLPKFHRGSPKSNLAPGPRRVPALVTEADPSGSPIGEAEVSNAVVRLSLAVEKITELLKAAQLLHTQLADLDAALTEVLVDLEGSLKNARGETSG